MLSPVKRNGPLSVFCSNSVLKKHHTRLLLHSFCLCLNFYTVMISLKILLCFSWQWDMLFLFLIKIKVKHCFYNHVANELESCSFINNGIQFCLLYSNYKLVPTFFFWLQCIFLQCTKFHIVCFVYSARLLRLLKIQQMADTLVESSGSLLLLHCNQDSRDCRIKMWGFFFNLDMAGFL